GRDGAGRFDDLADAFVVGIADVDVAGGVQRHPVGVADVGRRGLPAVAVVADGAGAGDGGDDAVGFDCANAVVVPVGDEYLVLGVDGQGGGIVQLGGGGGAAVAAEAGSAGAGDGDDDAVGLDLADTLVVLVGEEDVAVAVEGHAPRLAQHRGGGRAVVAA